MTIQPTALAAVARGLRAAATALLAMTAGGTAFAAPPPGSAELSVLSGRPDMVTGGSALIGVRLPAGTPPAAVQLRVNGKPVKRPLRPSIDDPSLQQVLVDGLAIGANDLAAALPGNPDAAHLSLTNDPRSGPVFSGARSAPFECRTQESGLGAPLDRDCSAATRYDWFYLNANLEPKPLPSLSGGLPPDIATTITSEGKPLPFIVRIESDTINRSIYRIAVLAQPGLALDQTLVGWNRRVVLRFGESTAAQYNQGVDQATDVFKADTIDQQSRYALGKGFAYIVSSLNINKVNVNDVVAAETAMMLREHVAKTYGLPRWMLGMGGSGGAIQQLLVAQNYPGILDGVMPDAAFPDVMATAMTVTDCRLLNRYFLRVPASDAVRRAVEGHTKGTCASWDVGLGDAIVATRGAVTPACGLNDASLVYDPNTNPTGTRCTVYDVNAVPLGRNALGRAQRPLDNVGIQYGLQALQAGVLSVDDFLALNEGIGGYDGDGNLAPRRTVADAEGLRRAYQMGRVGAGAGGLAGVPMLQMRVYAEPAGDIHSIVNDIKLREQLLRSNGQAGNQVIWVLPHPGMAILLGLGREQQQRLERLLHDTLLVRFDIMGQWLDTLVAMPGPRTPQQVAQARPADAVDACWDPATTERHAETATYNGPGVCNTLFPKTPSPRMVAGAPLSDDVLKCTLKPIDPRDYLPVVFTPAQWRRLGAAFPEGVCDYTRPGAGQGPLSGTWLRY